MDQTELVARYILRCRSASTSDEDPVELADEILEAANEGRLRGDQASDLLILLREETGVPLFFKGVH